MHRMPRCLAAAALALFAAPGIAQVTLFEHDGFRGNAYTADGVIPDFEHIRFNDRASSISIDRGTWEVCEHAYFEGRCELLGPGNYPSMRDFGLNDRISSVRPIRGGRDGGRYDDRHRGLPPDRDDYAYRRRPDERLYEADVTSVRAVFDDRGRNCWTDHDYRNDYGRRDKSNAGGAIAGALIGGIIGHQIGDGSGRTAATVAGAAAGAAIGSKSGRHDERGYDYDRGYERGMVRCDDSGRGRPQFWDVSYEFRGVEHWVRLRYPPGRTITVNRHGEPRE